jgi:hypothetical protein
MRDAPKATEVTIVTRSTEGLTGVVQVNTPKAEMKFEIMEDLMHKICTDLERFITREVQHGFFRSSKHLGKT